MFTTIDTAERDGLLPKWQAELVSQIIKAASSYYCLPDKIEQQKNNLINALVTALQQINADHSADRPSTNEQYKVYLDAINKVLEAFDPHLHLQFNEEFIKTMKAENRLIIEGSAGKFDFSGGPPRHVLAEMNAFRGQPELNYGFITKPPSNITIPSDIGYLKIDVLLDPSFGADEKEGQYRLGPNAIEALEKAMQKMVGKKGIILDLTEAPEGGSPEMVQYIVSFFIKQKGMVINEIEDRLTNTTTTYKALKTPYDLSGIPLQIITDKTTFSGREEIAYDLQQYNKRLQAENKSSKDHIQIIGDVTVGGAHPERSFPLIDSSGRSNDQLTLRIPHARSVNPVSKTNWEEGPAQEGKKSGVHPDITVPVDQNKIARAVHNLRAIISRSNTRESKIRQDEVTRQRLNDVGTDITAEQMAKSDFGSASNTAKAWLKESTPRQRQSNNQQPDQDSSSSYSTPSPFRKKPTPF